MKKEKQNRGGWPTGNDLVVDLNGMCGFFHSSSINSPFPQQARESASVLHLLGKMAELKGFVNAGM